MPAIPLNAPLNVDNKRHRTPLDSSEKPMMHVYSDVVETPLCSLRNKVI